MGFFKEYPNRKDWRKPHRGSKRFDSHCRNHGSCGYCQNERLYQIRKERARVDEQLKAYEIGVLI